MPKILFRTISASLCFFVLAACGGASNDRSQPNSEMIEVATTPAATLAMACSGCHSTQNGAIAALGVYDQDALRATMMRYKTEVDGTTVMHRLARGYSEAEIDLISAYLGRSEGTP